METDFAPETGREFTMRDVPQGSWDGITRGRVLECRAPYHIRFSWQGGGHDLEVCYRLQPNQSGGTDFVLEHSGFRGVSGLFLSVFLRFGWGGYLNKVIPGLAAHIDRHGFAVPFATPGKAERLASRHSA